MAAAVAVTLEKRDQKVASAGGFSTSRALVGARCPMFLQFLQVVEEGILQVKLTSTAHWKHAASKQPAAHRVIVWLLHIFAAHKLVPHKILPRYHSALAGWLVDGSAAAKCGVGVVNTYSIRMATGK
jgi:hypothetical protein